MNATVKPLRDHWRTGNLLKKIDELVAQQSVSDDALFDYRLQKSEA
ncbi:hypothetical protein [Glutamicibacter sp.]